MKSHLLNKVVFSIISLIVLVMLTACAGVGTTTANGSVTTITGTIASVSATNHSVTLSVNGQTYTVNGLSDQEVQTLQNQVGQTYAVQVTQNSDGSYSITANTNPTQANGATPGVSETPEATDTPDATSTTSENGSISSLIAPIQSVSSSSLTVTLPDNTKLTMAITAQTDQSNLNGAQLSVGEKVKVDINGSASGFTADSIKLPDSGDLTDANTVDFQGTVTQTVGSDQMLHFTIGTQSFSYALNSSTDLGDFNNNASSIASGTAVKVKVQFNGTTGTITKVSNTNN